MIKKQQRRGFTIIEVVLVLAIAGLIFLMVFIALPALRRSRADTQRRNDASAFMSQMNQYQTNNRGKVVNSQADLNRFLADYMKQKADGSGEFLEPGSGNNYRVKYSADKPGDSEEMTYYAGRICDGESMTSTGAGARTAALIVKLEGSGFFCADLK